MTANCVKSSFPRPKFIVGVSVLVTALSALVICLSCAPAFAGSVCSKFAAEPSKGGSDSNTGVEAHPYATLKKLASSLSAGQTGCVFSGQTIDVKDPQTLQDETHGTEAQPITITSTNPSDPATVTSWLVLAPGSNWINFTHLNFWWEQPPPYMCWDANGDSTGNACDGQSVNSEDHVQIAISSDHTHWIDDNVQSFDTNICFNIVSYEGNRARETLFENDVIHDCGVPFTGEKTVNEEPAWHEHAIYDYGTDTRIANSYIYGNSRNGILWYGGGEGGVAEHDVIDDNGNGITFGNTVNGRAEWNIISNNSLDDSGQCAEPHEHVRGCDDFAVASSGTSGGVFKNNCTYNNLSGEIEYFTSEPAEMNGVEVGKNMLKINPLYKDAATHEYALSTSSPCLGYGPDTAQPPPTVTTGEASTVKSEEATLSGTINPESLDTKYYFEYGITSSYGMRTAEINAGSGTSGLVASAAIAELEPGVTYHFRLVAASVTGTTPGEDRTFTTEMVLSPRVTAGIARRVGGTQAELASEVFPHGLDTDYYFQYGPSTEYGSTQPLPPGVDAGSSTEGVPVTATLTGLTPARTYHFRVVATNIEGTGYGKDETFTTEAVLPSEVAEVVSVTHTEAEVDPSGSETNTSQRPGPTTEDGSPPSPSSIEAAHASPNVAGLTSIPIIVFTWLQPDSRGRVVAKNRHSPPKHKRRRKKPTHTRNPR
jgi:hypothetical protein